MLLSVFFFFVQTHNKDGELVQEELVISLGQMWFSISTSRMILRWFAELISSSWKATSGISMKPSLQCGQHPTIVIGKNSMFCQSHDESIFNVWNLFRCGNVAAILELDENLHREFTIFEAAPQETRGIPSKKPQADYFL